MFSPSNYYFSNNFLLLCSLLIIITITHAWEAIDDHHSAEVMDIANHVLTQLPARVDYDEFLPFIEVTDEKVNRGDVFVKVWDAQQEEAAGTTYKLTLSVHHPKLPRPTGSCLRSDDYHHVILGGLQQITVYKPLPEMGQPLSITDWGTVVECYSETLLTLMAHHSS